MVEPLLVMVVITCAFLAIRAQRLLVAALWLAGCSAFVSILFYLMGAHEVAVIELSVGAGLVTVLFVLAISVAGEDTTEIKSVIPRPIALGLILGSIGLLALMVLPSIGAGPTTGEPAFAEVMWQQRGLDALVQTGLIFAAVVGLLGLLADAKVRVHAKQPVRTTPAEARQPLSTPAESRQPLVRPAAPEVKA